MKKVVKEPQGDEAVLHPLVQASGTMAPSGR